MAKYRILTREGVNLNYDTELGTLVREDNGESVVPYLESINIKPTYSNELHPRKTLRILMGTKCNFDCAYCSQAFSRVNNEETSIKDVDVFLEGIDEWLPTLGKIEFWGGEPLVYIKYLRKLIPTLRKKLPEDVNFTIISNGSLLTDEIGDFLAKYRVFYSISHDAYGQEKSRGADPLDDPEHRAVILRTFEKINTAQAKFLESEGKKPWRVCSFNVVWTKHNLNPVRVQQWFNEKMGVSVPVSCDPVMGKGNGEGNSDVLPNPEEQVELARNVFFAGLLPEGYAPFMLYNRVSRFMRDLSLRQPLEQQYDFCGITSTKSIVVDLKGNFYPCQNYVTKADVRGNVYKEEVTPPPHKSYREKACCMNCPFVALCHGGCPLATGNSFVETCEVKFAYCMGLWAAAVKLMSGLTPYKIEGKIVRPIRELIETSHGKTMEVDVAYIPQPEAFPN